MSTNNSVAGYAITDFFEKDFAMFLALTAEHREYTCAELRDIIFALNPKIETAYHDTHETHDSHDTVSDSTEHTIARYIHSDLTNEHSHIQAFVKKILTAFPLVKTHYHEYV